MQETHPNQEQEQEAPKPRHRKVNHKPENKTTTRKVQKTESKEVVLTVEEPVPNKYEKKTKVGTPTLGRSANYVSKVGLGNLTTVTAHGNTDV